jgi:hypothetical protein
MTDRTETTGGGCSFCGHLADSTDWSMCKRECKDKTTNKLSAMTTEHPWVAILRRKLRERGFKGDRLEEEVDRMVIRFPFLRPKRDPNEGLYRAINKSLNNG